MTRPVADSRIVNPFVPSLFHMGLVKVALPLFTNFDVPMLVSAFAEIQAENSSDSNESHQEKLTIRRNTRKQSIACNENGQENREDTHKEESTEALHGRWLASSESRRENPKVRYNRAKESLLLLPRSFRKAVLEAVHGMSYEARGWGLDHLLIGKRKWTFHWKSDGTIDRIKTAQQLVWDESIGVIKRFEIACVYCLEDTVQTLWTKMEASGRAKRFKTVDNSVVRFWVRWIREKSWVSWTRAAKEYLDLPRKYSRTPMIRLGSLFPCLRPNERRKFLYSLTFTTEDDFRASLYILTEGEQEKILKNNPKRLLLIYLNWPLQSLFLETAEKMWMYIDNCTFIILLGGILLYNDLRADFDYGQLFEDFWASSPNRLRKAAMECPRLSKSINSFFDERRRKRKADDDRIEEMMSKCQIGKNLKEEKDLTEKDSNFHQGHSGV